MAANPGIDPVLLEKALKIGGQKTKHSTINLALSEFIDRRKQKEIIKLFGSIVYEPGYDYKMSRKR